MTSTLMIVDRDFALRSGSRARIAALVNLFRASDYRISFLAPDTVNLTGLAIENEPVFRAPVSAFRRGDPAALDRRPYVPALAQACGQVTPNVVVAEYLWLSPLLALTPASCVRLVDTHSVFHARVADYRAAGLDPWVACSASEEAALLAHADGILAIQADEADALRAMLPGHPVAVVPHPVEVVTNPKPSCGSAMLFVGAAHAGNLGIRTFVETALPRIIRRVPDAELWVCGDIVRHLSAAPGLRLLGRVEDVGSVYDETAVVVCPIELGSGLKIKVIEALAAGRAIVGSARAFAGMPTLSSPAWCVADTPAEQADAVVALLNNPARRHAMEVHALSYASAHFSREVARKRLTEVIQNGRGRRSDM